ncbi:hypothetical protein BBP40_012593 [Aspergillus hancockii]|nr:hypothetical protein BBP40_012593 [Aspergillus hancockii]
MSWLITFLRLDGYPRKPSWLGRRALIASRRSNVRTAIGQIYGKYHWAPFVHKLSPTLKEDDPAKYRMVLETMDAIHLCLMLVDDVHIRWDGSDFRKGQPTAHKIYGPSETANRAYYRVTQILNKVTKDFPTLAPWLMQDLEEILEGQDLSLVWRRDGLSNFPIAPADRVAAYRRMTSLKTGALFRLLGHLVLEKRSMDDTLTLVATTLSALAVTSRKQGKIGLAWVLDVNGFRNVHDMTTATSRSSSPEGDMEEMPDEIGVQYEKIIRGPLDYLLSIPGKNVRGRLISAFNEWFHLPAEKLDIVKEVIELLHTASLLIDDIQDASRLRRGQPVAHSIWGIAQTINSANYAYYLAQEKLHKLQDPQAFDIFTQELLSLHRGQGMDLYWRDALVCPSEEYIQMVTHKAGGLFRLAVGLMQIQSQVTMYKSPLPNSYLIPREQKQQS